MITAKPDSVPLHPRGKFAYVNGVEVPCYSTMSAGTFGVPVDAVTLHRDRTPPGITELQTSMQSEDDAGITIPRKEVDRLLIWDWFVLFEGEWYRVQNEQDGRFLIWTSDYQKARADPGWEGEQYNGWDRWIDAAGAQVRAESHDY